MYKRQLLFVGASTRRKLEKSGVQTIGELARRAPEALEKLLGKNGRTLWLFANGLDSSPVARTTAKLLVRSVGNGTTAPRDLISDADVKLVLNGPVSYTHLGAAGHATRSACTMPSRLKTRIRRQTASLPLKNSRKDGTLRSNSIGSRWTG